MSLDQQAPLAALRDRVYEILSSDHNHNMVAVVGWKPSWHDEVTRRIERAHEALFIDELLLTDLGQRIGLVLYTYRVGHSQMNRVKTRIPIAPIYLRPHQIHELFRIWLEVRHLQA